MNSYLSVFFLFVLSVCYSQTEEDSTKIRYQDIQEVYTDKDFYSKYNRILRRVRKVYPLALYAAEQIKELDEELKQVDKKRKKKKLTKEVNAALKDDFYYVIRDMYVEEGKLLMKLIHRETGMTVREIIKKYKGGFKAEMNETLGKLWEQDLDATYDPKGEGWIVEIVIQDVKNGKVRFEKEPRKLTKEEYKASQKQYKIDKKAAKKGMRKKRKSGG